MQGNNKHFSDLSEYLRCLCLAAPAHPLLAVVAMSAKHHFEVPTCLENSTLISTDFYTIALQKIISTEMDYGRTQYDCRQATMHFTAPKQSYQSWQVKVVCTAKAIILHQDFVDGTPIEDEIRQYHFFSYGVNEALHLSAKEEAMVAALMENIEQEYSNNYDQFSKGILLSYISSLLRLINRYYRRQFLQRKDCNVAVQQAFLHKVEQHYHGVNAADKTMPSVAQIAASLAMTPCYLTDALKAETGKTAMENLHFYLIDKAKGLLQQPHSSVTEVAHSLGFDYPQYFARLFKKIVGQTPSQFKNQLH